MSSADTRPFSADEPHVIGRTATSAAGAGGDNIVDLMRELVGQGTHLADQQLSLIKAEVRESAADVKTAVGGMLGAAVVGIAGLGVVLMGVAYLLADAIDNLGLATLIVGALTLLLAYLLYRGAVSKMSATHISPDRSQRTLGRTPDALRGEL
ncbi:phage holin family protein [Sphingomonas sp. LY29]|uniref:phage holin family protein n=1 Tax=Sphingomonas sp. LY29 TaxID=3095341 RepID=UPI002D787740|nr:phage holin family protein [Sphingomonas sp. LY29]WRP26623.1 phage holin family protein [Sphingomonas sp. LY29]